jgi:glycosyltransferase involved in cell wall biosynthesis
VAITARPKAGSLFHEWVCTLRIVHIGSFKIGTTNGNYNALWSLAKAQAAAGDSVTILRVGKTVPQEQRELAAVHGVELVGFPCERWINFWSDPSGVFERLLGEFRPHVAHLQYVRVPKYHYIARALKRRNVPFVISTHGGLHPTEMLRRGTSKRSYWKLIESGVHKLAAGIHFVSQAERDNYVRDFGAPHRAAVIPNAVEVPSGIAWKGLRDAAAPRLAFFGRYDIWHKGLDLTAETLRLLWTHGLKPELHLYGGINQRFARQVRDLLEKYREIPIVDHGLVLGEQKFRKMAEYDLYIQHSRFELFGMSLVEAMGLGVPALVSSASDLMPELRQSQAAFEIPLVPERAAAILAAILKDHDRITQVAGAGRRWMQQECSPDSIARKMREFYQEVYV